MKCIEIEIKGKVSPIRFKNWQEVEVNYSKEGNTLLSGRMNDQSYLFGLLANIRDLGAELISVNLIDRKDL